MVDVWKIIPFSFHFVLNFKISKLTSKKACAYLCSLKEVICLKENCIVLKVRDENMGILYHLYAPFTLEVSFSSFQEKSHKLIPSHSD